MLVFRDFGVADKDLHKGTQCSIAFNKSCSHRLSTSSRTDRFFSGNNRQSKSREPGGTTPLAPSDNCKVAVEFSSDRAVSSLAKNVLYIFYHPRKVSKILIYIPTGDLDVGTVIPNMGPCGKHPYLVPEVTEANPNAIASSAACCLFNATFKLIVNISLFLKLIYCYQKIIYQI